MAQQRTVFPRDWGLQSRMLLTMFLLGLVYVAFVGVLVTAGAGAVTMVVVIGALTLAQLFLSDKLGLAAMGAKEVSPEEAPGLHAMIERLCIQADLPKPKIAVADTEVPNAFAMGRSQKSATICATTGIMKTLTPAELEGVMAHELTHVKNRDVLVMTVASFFASVASMMLQFSFFFGGGGDDDDGAPAAIVILLASLLVYVISFFLMLALSRYREFSADRGAALITGRPSALAAALQKISGQMDAIPQRDLRQAESMNAFFIVPAGVKNSVRSLFATHPPMEKRIERLVELETQLQRPASAVGFLDALLGGKDKKLKAPAPDRLFAMTTAQITLETSLAMKHRGVAGIVFQPLGTGDFGQIVRDTEGLLRSSAKDTGSELKTADDEFGYRWLILHDPDFDDLVVSLNMVSTELQGGGYGDRLLCAVFAFEEEGKPVYFIYNFKRGAWYPFVPTGSGQARDSERELRLKAQLGGELPIEADVARWFPLWEIPL